MANAALAAAKQWTFKPATRNGAPIAAQVNIPFEFSLADNADELVGNLSHGDQRRVEIAVCMALEPKVLMLDEPASGLSRGERGLLTDMLLGLDEEITLDRYKIHTIEAVVDRLVMTGSGSEEERRANLTRLTDSVETALKLARERGLDLVEIAPTAVPPVCRLMDYGKFKYQEQKRAADAKAKQKVIEIKEVKFRPGTDEGDYAIKMRNLRRFIAEDGDKGKVTLRFRGREITHQDIGMRMLERIRDELADVAELERHRAFGAEVAARRLVLPGEAAAQPDVGEAVHARRAAAGRIHRPDLHIIGRAVGQSVIHMARPDPIVYHRSIAGIALAALILILLPEYMRAFSDYRMLIFGAAMVLMMIFRPQGIIPYVRRTYEFSLKGETSGKG